MSETSSLDFERAEPAAPAADGIRCAACGQPIIDAYWQVNALVACEKCKNLVARERATRRPGRFFLAALYGTLAAAVGAAVWYAVRAATDYEFGLIAIVIGLGVGFAVKKGAQGRGGWAYQGLAMLLTYVAISSTYVPLIVKAAAAQRNTTAAAPPATDGAAPVQPASAPAPAADPAPDPAPAASKATAGKVALAVFGYVVSILVLLAIAMAVPFLAGLENLMGLAIIAFGLYEAWKINKAQPLAVSGPFDAKTAAGGGGAAVA